MLKGINAVDIYKEGYRDALKDIKELASMHAIANYGEEGAQISMLICMLVEEVASEQGIRTTAASSN